MKQPIQSLDRVTKTRKTKLLLRVWIKPSCYWGCENQAVTEGVDSYRLPGRKSGCLINGWHVKMERIFVHMTIRTWLLRLNWVHSGGSRSSGRRSSRYFRRGRYTVSHVWTLLRFSYNESQRKGWSKVSLRFKKWQELSICLLPSHRSRSIGNQSSHSSEWYNLLIKNMYVFHT